MEGLGYGEVDMDDVQRIDMLERDVTQLKQEVDITSDHRPYTRLSILTRNVTELAREIETLKLEIAKLKQQQPSTVHHHYHGGQSPLYEAGKTYYKGGSGLGGATA